MSVHFLKKTHYKRSPNTESFTNSDTMSEFFLTIESIFATQILMVAKIMAKIFTWRNK